MTRALRSYSAEGIVLRRRNIGEADSIFVVFGEAEGKFEGVARGIRKARSKMRGHLEPLNYCRFQLARARSIDIFTQAETIRSFPGIASDLDSWATASYLLELVDRFTVERAEIPELFTLLYASLESLNDGASLSLVSRYFELHLLSIAGVDLQVDSCASCQEHLPQEETLLAVAAGGLVCRTCRPSAGVGRLIDVPAIKVLRHARRTSLPDFVSLRIPDDVGRELQGALGEVIRYQLDRDLGTARFVRELDDRSRATTQTEQTL